ncbi:hypothetical protein Egran_01539 [Elaphomyces granulatus]|uniref:Cytochrome P450 n=1 Tax=Elaphomyces granulatus TaxID=519963 RepID=A0A232M2Q7_9EURO|nr:hypothetical protein Egran_01539 [Elaphomyces granulatus]
MFLMIFTTLVASLACFIFLYYLLYSNRSGESHISRINDPNLCRLVIAGRYKKHNQLPPLLARALPNQRLRIAFGINNVFTSNDESYVKDFVKKAKDSIKVTPDEWSYLSDHARNVVKTYLMGSDNSPVVRIKLTSLIQVLSMRLAIWVLFGRAKDGPTYRVQDRDLVSLAEAINQRWLASKGNEIPRFEEDHDLQAGLSAVFPDHNILDPEGNPLNLVMPAFETLWRAALRMFIEVRFITGRRSPEWHQALAEFARKPTKEQFTLQGAEGGISAEFLVSEALRLYPPTRRIHRAFKWAGSDSTVTIAADIEASHSMASIWGPDATTFNPRRWGSISAEQRNAYFPFGSRPFLCPASSVFGPWMIGLLVGALIGELPKDWRLDSANQAVLKDLNSGGRLRGERDAYEEVWLAKDLGRVD